MQNLSTGSLYVGFFIYSPIVIDSKTQTENQMHKITGLEGSSVVSGSGGKQGTRDANIDGRTRTHILFS